MNSINVTTTNGKIAFAHTEIVIDFTSMDNIKKFVKEKEDNNQKIFYCKYSNGDLSEISRTFDEGFVFVPTDKSRYTLTIRIPYENYEMGI